MKYVVDAEEGSRKEEPREVESEDIAENEITEDAQGGERVEVSKEDAKDDVEEYEDGIVVKDRWCKGQNAVSRRAERRCEPERDQEMG